MSFPRYPSYKESPAEWITCLPSHWNVTRLKRRVSSTNAGEVIDKSYWGGEEELLYTCAIQPMWSDFHDFPDWKRTTTHDLLLTRNGTPYIHKPVERSIYTNVVQRITLSNPLERDFLALAAQSAANNLQGYGVSIESLNYGMWSELLIPAPPLEEALSIVSFIDRETTKIDALIAEQERLIELLQEKRQAVISHAVTKGLNPDAPMKDSGVEWLGDVPEHWDTKSLKYIVRMKSGDFITSDSIETEGSYPVFGGNGLRGFTDAFNREGAYALIGRQGALCGNVNTASGRFWASEHAIVCIHKKETDLGWLCQMLEAANLNQYSTSAAQPGLSVEVIGNIKVPCPPTSEQVAIGAWLEQELSKIDATIKTANHLIAVLGERRSALISAAVSGQIDVRGLAPAGEAI